jgi:hypothetical protein
MLLSTFLAKAMKPPWCSSPSSSLLQEARQVEHRGAMPKDRGMGQDLQGV